MLGSCVTVFPLSAAQHQLWLNAASNPRSCAYHNAHLIRFSGPLDDRRLADSIRAIVARHDTLRTSLRTTSASDGDVVAVVAAAADVVMPTIDLTALAAAEYNGYAQRFVEDLARAPFDLSSGPLLRMALLRFDATTHALALVVHEIVWDRVSFEIFCRELAALYCAGGRAGVASLASLPESYGDCVHAERVEYPQTGLQFAYWQTLLAGEREVLALPADRARPAVEKHRGESVAFTLDAALVQRLAAVADANGATMFMLVFATFLVLTGRYSGQTDLVVGTPVAARGRTERERLIGHFENVLPLRIRTVPHETFAAFLGRFRTAASELLAHADVPFGPSVSAQLAQSQTGRNPFFDVIFDFQNAPPAVAWPPDMAVEAAAVDIGTARFDLAAVLRPDSDGTLDGRFTFNVDVFERPTIELMVLHFGVLLDAMARDPHRPADQLALASPEEIGTILRLWSTPAASPFALPLAGSAATLHALVERAAARVPGAIALVEAGHAPITYAELERRANALAYRLRASGVDRNVRVGLFLDRAASTVVAMLATLKAGGAYVPLDPAYPVERTAHMVGAADVRLIVARHADRAAAAGYRVPVLDLNDAAPADLSRDTAPNVGVEPDDLAYVLFTSGSTGQPKAVAITHRGVVALISTTPELVCTAQDVALLHAALTFDMSTFIWGPLAYGARVAVMPPGPFSLAEFGACIRASNVTLLDASPALFHQLVEEQIDDLRGLRRCIVGGDVLSPAHCETFVDRVPMCRLFNGYGPTETTVIATLAPIRAPIDAGRRVPIGLPIAQARVYILDDRLCPVGIGIPGELCVGGAGVARSYLNDPAQTAERFVPDPFACAAQARMYRSGDRARWLPTGEADFLGRRDAQVKIRGFRIEPAEIEFALLEHPAVRNAAVIVRKMELGERALIAYAEVRPGAADEAQLRAFLTTKLPPHAIPARIVLLDQLALTSSGKIDRLRLPDPGAPAHGAIADAPQSDAERTVAAIISELLHVERVGRSTDFFALGGHSLLATRVISRIADAFDIDVSLRGFFAAPTVTGVAALIAQLPRRAPARPDGLEARLESLSLAEIDALLAQALAPRRVPQLRLRCVLIGESMLVLRCAQTLHERGHDIVAVLVPSTFDVAAWAREHAIGRIDSPAALDAVVGDGDIDYLFSIVNTQIVGPAVLAQLRHTAINLHDGPLPRYAGHYATTFAIAAQEIEHAVTWHEVSSVIDGGRILKQVTLPIEIGETAFTLNMKCYDAASASFGELIAELETGRSVPYEQNAARRTYHRRTERLSPASIIDFTQPAATLSAFVRALDFGPTVNPLGLPKIVVDETVYCCRSLELLAEAAGGRPGEIVRFEGAALVVAARDQNVRLRAPITLAGEAVSAGELVARHGRRGSCLSSWPSSVAATIARLDLAAATNEPYWTARLANLDVLEITELHAGDADDGIPAGRFDVEGGGADGCTLIAALSAALASHTAAAAGDVLYVASAGPADGPLIDALFAPGVPLRIELGCALPPDAIARDLRGRIAELERHGSFARDVFARFPALRALPATVRTGAFPLAIAFADAAGFERATSAAALTLLVERRGTRAALLHGPSAGSQRLAQRLAHEIAALVRADIGGSS